jgi:hypothetical protein
LAGRQKGFSGDDFIAGLYQNITARWNKQFGTGSELDHSDALPLPDRIANLQVADNPFWRENR